MKAGPNKNMMKNLIINLMSIAILMAVLFSCEEKQQKSDSYFMYVASDNAEDGVGIGIFEWNPKTGDLATVGVDSTFSTSSYLTIDTTTNRLYNINQQFISAYDINTKDGSLSLLNQIPITGRGACYISVSNDHNYVLAGYYSSGSLASYNIKENGSIGSHVSGFEHRGSSINTERQERAHVHMVYPVPQSNLILVPDLGIDNVLVYALDDSGNLIPTDEQYIAKIRPGGGPRHLAIHPGNQFVYVLHELTGHVTGFNFDPTLGFMDTINTASTLPAEFTEFNKSADIHITPNGQYLYASNRGHNSLAVFKVDQSSGAMSLVGIQSCGGDWPRAFAIDPSGEFILVANKRSDQVSVMKIDYATGLFNKVGEIATPLAPQGIRFVRKG